MNMFQKAAINAGLASSIPFYEGKVKKETGHGDDVRLTAYIIL